MTIVLFIVILLVLVLVHEFGHFVAAKKSGVRVDEFGVGFPPKLFGKKYGETEYTFNALPFGGFVRMHGEEPGQEGEDTQKSETSANASVSSGDESRKFTDQPLWKQAVVMVAGVAMNVALAWVLFSVNFMIGMPASEASAPAGASLEDPQLTATRVLDDSPAKQAGLISGDQFLSLASGGQKLARSEMNLERFQQFIAQRAGEEITVTYERGGEKMQNVLTPEKSVSEGAPDRAVIGVSLAILGTVSLAPPQAIWEGLVRTVTLTGTISVALAEFFSNAFTGQANFDQVAGPVGIVSLVGDSAALGLVHLLGFVAIISLHLAIINIIPFPALDGGRLLFLIIEAIKGSPINPKVAGTVNAIGFGLLILLMVVITYNDITRLVG